MEGQPHSGIVTIRPLLAVDRAQVEDLLADLPRLYPGAGRWLEERLRRLADFWVVTVGERIVGTWVESPKSDGRLKIANMYVADVYRGQGLGRTMVSQATERWLEGPHHSFYVTVSQESLPAVGALLHPYGFREAAVLSDRYRAGSSETVLAVSREDLVVDPPLPVSVALA